MATKPKKLKFDKYSFEGQVLHDLNKITAELKSLRRKEEKLMADLTALQAQVTSSIATEASAVTLIQALESDPTAVAAMVTSLQSSQTSLQAAITAATPAPAPAPASAT